MAERPRHEKEEEKRREKEEEKEQGWDEKWRRDRGSALTWAGLFIWGGLVLLAETTDFAARFSWWQGWGIFLAGAGIILIVQAVIRLLMPEHRRPVSGNLIMGFILLGLGLGGLVGWTFVWPSVLIIIGIIIVTRAFGRRA